MEFNKVITAIYKKNWVERNKFEGEVRLTPVSSNLNFLVIDDCNPDSIFRKFMGRRVRVTIEVEEYYPVYNPDLDIF
jgi:hypothetical protein